MTACDCSASRTENAVMAFNIKPHNVLYSFLEATSCAQALTVSPTAAYTYSVARGQELCSNGCCNNRLVVIVAVMHVSQYSALHEDGR